MATIPSIHGEAPPGIPEPETINIPFALQNPANCGFGRELDRGNLLPRRSEPHDARQRITRWPVSGLAETTRATFPETVISSGQRAS